MFVPLFERERDEERDPKSESDVMSAFVSHKTSNLRECASAEVSLMTASSPDLCSPWIHQVEEKLWSSSGQSLGGGGGVTGGRKFVIIFAAPWGSKGIALKRMRRCLED